MKERASGLFRRLAEVEAAMHGVSPDDVHFHEVGAIDSIVDVVGGVIGLQWLRADRFVSSPLNVGTGTVTMSHGTFPVPAPATARLVQGVPVYGVGEGELLTPTGALLVTAFASAYGPLPLLRPEAIGHGAGARDVPGRPNVLRLIVGEEDRPSPRRGRDRPGPGDRGRRRVPAAPRRAPGHAAREGRARRLLHPDSHEEGAAGHTDHRARQTREPAEPGGNAVS